MRTSEAAGIGLRGSRLLRRCGHRVERLFGDGGVGADEQGVVGLLLRRIAEDGQGPLNISLIGARRCLADQLLQPLGQRVCWCTGIQIKGVVQGRWSAHRCSLRSRCWSSEGT